MPPVQLLPVADSYGVLDEVRCAHATSPGSALTSFAKLRTGCMSPAFFPLQPYRTSGRSRHIGIHGADAGAAQNRDSDGEVRMYLRHPVKKARFLMKGGYLELPAGQRRRLRARGWFARAGRSMALPEQVPAVFLFDARRPHTVPGRAIITPRR